MKKKLVTAAAVLALALSACGGGGGGGRPSEDDISQALQTHGGGGLTDRVLNCMAEELHDSDLEDDTLQALVDGSDDDLSKDEQEKAITASGDAAEKCVSA